MSARAIISLLILAIMALTTSRANAFTSDRVRFENKPTVAVRVVEEVKGQTVLLVASNAGFNIRANDMVGEVKVSVETAGSYNGVNYGMASRLPGQKRAQTFVASQNGATIYQADRRTATQRGTIADQSVLITVSYDKIASPNIQVRPAP